MDEERINLLELTQEELFDFVDPIFKEAPCDLEGVCTGSRCPYFMQCNFNHL